MTIAEADIEAERQETQETGQKEKEAGLVVCDPSAFGEYRQHLVLASQTAQTDYDKTLLWLSGGALVLSLTLVEKILDKNQMSSPDLLLKAWLAWIASLTAVLTSFYFSRQALRKAIWRVDRGIVELRPGGLWAVCTEAANIMAGLLFVAGIASVVWFCYVNVR